MAMKSPESAQSHPVLPRTDPPRGSGAARALTLALCVSAFAALAPAQVDDGREVAVPRIADDVVLDGDLSDWGAFLSLPLTPGGASNETHGEFSAGEGDLWIDVRLAWDDDALWIGIVWRDDALDTRLMRSADDAMWQSDDRSRRDLMYVYDNIGVHVAAWGTRHMNWLAPRAKPPPFQWDSVFQTANRRVRRSPDALADAVAVVAGGEGGGPAIVSIEARLAWASFPDADPAPNQSIHVLVIAPDSDAPDMGLDGRFEQVSYLSLIADVVLHEVSPSSS